MAGGLAKPRLLFLAPARPHPTGNGIAMRIWAVAQALGRRYEVVVAVPSEQDASLRERIRRSVYDKFQALYRKLYTTPRFWPGETGRPGALTRSAFDAVHVFRHYVAPYAAPYLGRIPCQLDLDESEAKTCRRLASLHCENGDNRRAEVLEWESAFYQQAEREWLPRFDRLFVSSSVEREYLIGLGLGLQPLVLPNSVTLPEATSPPPSGGPFTFLFVGSMKYYPNLDAVKFFAREILPLLRQRTARTFRVRIAGSGPDTLHKLLKGMPDAEWLGFVENLNPLYQESHAVIAPLRAGGGTRIKVLEAFSYRRPVVATTVGSEGLAAVPEQHFLRADTAGEFASACVRLMEDAELGTRLTKRAYDLVAAHYGPAALEQILG